MTDTKLPDIAILLGESGRDYEFASALMRAGFVVYVCTSPQQVHALVRAGKRPVLLAGASQASAFNDPLLPKLICSPHAPVGEGKRETETAWGIDVRAAGPDPQGHANSVLRALRQHLDAPRPQPKITPPPPATWRLTAPPRRLVDPQERALPLTLTEWQFISLLLLAPNRVLTFEQWQDTSLRDGLRQSHNVAVLVSRLRRKAAHRGIKLPLQAVRGVGYTFTEPCERTRQKSKRAA